MVKSLDSTDPFAARLNLPEDVRVPIEHTVATSTLRTPIPDVTAEARAALESPLKYPAFAEGVVPGDKLAIALDEAVPDAVNVVRGVIAAALAAGIEAEAISIVSSDEPFCIYLREELGTNSRVVVHDPEDEQDLALVALSEKNERLLMNREIFEADIVLPIGCARLAGTAGCSVYESLYPRLSNAETIGRLRTPSQRANAARLTKSKHKSDEAGWLLGVPLVMQVVPGGDGTVAAVVAGDPEAVAERVQAICHELWSFEVPQQASLVIANVPGGPREQTWENIGRALAAIEPLVAEYGAVAICSDLDDRPGHAMGQLIGSEDYAAVESNVRNDHSADSWTAWHIARALQRGPVYFLSRLAADDVEEMGLAPVADLEELARLASHQESCIVLDHSQYAVATVSGES
ncbi:MAG: lactate racemase domain-containing protein [Pirellulales bacterium]